MNQSDMIFGQKEKIDIKLWVRKKMYCLEGTTVFPDKVLPNDWWKFVSVLYETENYVHDFLVTLHLFFSCLM